MKNGQGCKAGSIRVEMAFLGIVHVFVHTHKLRSISPEVVLTIDFRGRPRGRFFTWTTLVSPLESVNKKATVWS